MSRWTASMMLPAARWEERRRASLFERVGYPSCGLHEGKPRPKQAAGANCRLRGCQQLELVPACQAVCHESLAARLSLANKAEL